MTCSFSSWKDMEVIIQTQIERNVNRKKAWFLGLIHLGPRKVQGEEHTWNDEMCPHTNNNFNKIINYFILISNNDHA
jgi:hypothetical protein